MTDDLRRRRGGAPRPLILLLALALFAAGEQSVTSREARVTCDPGVLGLATDFGELAQFRAANASLGAPKSGENRVVFFGDSITAFWIGTMPAFFQGRPYVDRGIGGQTSPQMLVRFRQDVVALRPRVVVILAGINDLHGATGPATPAMVEDNLASMVEIARANGIRPVLASLLPNVGARSAIAETNRWIAAYASAHDLVFLDYHAALADAVDGLPKHLSPDGLHPNLDGYKIMAPLAEKAIAATLAKADAR